MNFYGAGAPSPSNVVTPSVPSGTVYTAVLSGIGAGFQGYLIAQCNFQFAHGFAFITDGVGANGGLSQGYLAGVIPDTNQVARATANPIGSVTAKAMAKLSATKRPSTAVKKGASAPPFFAFIRSLKSSR